MTSKTKNILFTIIGLTITLGIVLLFIFFVKPKIQQYSINNRKSTLKQALKKNYSNTHKVTIIRKVHNSKSTSFYKYSIVKDKNKPIWSGIFQLNSNKEKFNVDYIIKDYDKIFLNYHNIDNSLTKMIIKEIGRRHYKKHLNKIKSSWYVSKLKNKEYNEQKTKCLSRNTTEKMLNFYHLKFLELLVKQKGLKFSTINNQLVIDGIKEKHLKNIFKDSFYKKNDNYTSCFFFIAFSEIGLENKIQYTYNEEFFINRPILKKIIVEFDGNYLKKIYHYDSKGRLLKKIEFKKGNKSVKIPTKAKPYLDFEGDLFVESVL